MNLTTLKSRRRASLPLALITAGLLAGCSGGTDDAASADTKPAFERTSPSNLPEQPIANAPADFEGTMQQVVISVGPDAIRSVAGSNDLATVLALSPDEVIEAVHSGTIEAESIQESTLEIDGRMGRLQTEGDASYTILDGTQVAAHVVDHENGMVITMDPARMAEAAAARGESAGEMELEVEEVGEREIRGFDATGYRFEFMGDNIATVWLSEDLESQTGPIFDIWLDVNPLGRVELGGDGAPVRTVMVNPETLASGRGFMPAYTITEFYDLQPGDVADDRFDLPEGYQRMGMADLGRGAQ